MPNAAWSGELDLAGFRFRPPVTDANGSAKGPAVLTLELVHADRRPDALVAFLSRISELVAVRIRSDEELKIPEWKGLGRFGTFRAKPGKEGGHRVVHVPLELPADETTAALRAVVGIACALVDAQERTLALDFQRHQTTLEDA